MLAKPKIAYLNIEIFLARERETPYGTIGANAGGSGSNLDRKRGPQA
jgi:hypothetical protein